MASALTHLEDTNELAYKRDGSELIGIRQNGAIQVYDASTNHAIVKTLTDEHEESATGLTISDSFFATAGSDGKVMMFDANDNEFTKLLFRSQVPLRDVVFNSSGNKVAIASDDNSIRVVLVNDVSNVLLLDGHRATAKSVAYDPLDRYLVSSACDGSVIIWDVDPTSGPPIAVKKLNDQLPRTLPDVHRNRNIAWNPSGSLVAIPGKNGSVQLIQRGTWTIAHTLVHRRIEDATCMKWSSNGLYLAVTGKHHHIFVWDTKARKIVSERDADREVTALVWHPGRNELAFTLTGYGKLVTWDSVVPDDLPGPNKKLQQTTQKAANVPSSMPTFFDDMAMADTLDDDDDDEGEALDEEDAEDLEGEELDENLFSDMESVQGLPAEGQRQAPIHHVKGLVSSLEWPMRFQPGSTTFKRMANPTTPEESERRYLDFNLVGLIYTVYRSTNSIINVEFHDQSQNRNFHFSDYVHYTMGALGSNGLVFGVEGQEKPKERRSGAGNLDDDVDDLSDSDDEEFKTERTPSMVHYRPLNTWSNYKEWTSHLPMGEDVEAVAINDVSVIVTTSNGYVRIFSLSGLQTHIFCIQDVVSIVGRSDLALIVCSTGPTINKQQQNLEFILVNTSDKDIIQRGPLPLSNESELTWIGFSETSQPATYDTNGVLRILHRQRRPGQSAWVPVFDGQQTAAKRGRTESYWPVGLLHDRLMCVILRGQITEPYFPVPLSTEVELHIPTATVDPKCDDLEETFLRKRIITLHERDEADATDSADQYESELGQADLDMDKALLQLIQLACKSEKLTRALDLANALHLSRSVDAAIQIASHHRLGTLADKFTEVKEVNFMNHQRQRNPQTVTLHDFQQEQVELFPSSTSTMSSDLAFVDRGRNNDSIPTNDSLPSNRKRPSTEPSMFDDTDDMLFDDSMMDLDTTMTSPLPKRSR
ncbi:hypothetical protein [Absidia glauca]|uniref:Uncharacterized protein n=1 Tax=Absidia glauca TaxID=4829 RepID=A0A168QL41_ABSGL|nr:hypothetical protein [Absidia glauca]